MKIELIKYPTNTDWQYCKICTLNTVGKRLGTNKEVTSEWKRKILLSEHSPIRELWFGFKMEIPYWVSVHFTRHHEGVNHFVQTQRSDRTGIDRNETPQGAIVSHIMTMNAQALINMSHKRLCKQASKETREVMQKICKQVIEVCPELEGLLVPNCLYRNGKCTEFFPCNKPKNEEVEFKYATFKPQINMEELRKVFNENLKSIDNVVKANENFIWKLNKKYNKCVDDWVFECCKKLGCDLVGLPFEKVKEQLELNKILFELTLTGDYIILKNGVMVYSKNKEEFWKEVKEREKTNV